MFNHAAIAFSDCVLAYDLSEQKYLFISPGIYPVLGITAKQLYENNCLWNDLIDKQDLPCVNHTVKNLTENNPVELSYQINTPQCAVKNITDKKSLVIDEATGHQILLSVIKETPIKRDSTTVTIPHVSKKHQQRDEPGIGRGVNQRLKTEAEINNAAQKLDTVIENITDSFFILDNDWRFVRVNSAFEKSTGRNRDQVLGLVIWDVFPSLVNTGFDRSFREAKTKQVSLKFTEGLMYSKLWFNVLVYPSAEGLTVFVRNISDEKRARETAESTQNSLEALINNTADQVWSVDVKTRYVYMNNAYIKYIAYLTGIAPQKGDYSHMHMDNSRQVIEDWQNYYQRALKGEHYTIIRESSDWKTKEIRFYEINFNPIYATNGNIMGVGCFARDITNRLKTEQELLRQNKRLRNIASLSSHELRRPVASMLGLINIMDKENPYNPENRQIIDYLCIVSTEIDDVIRLIVDHTFTGN